MVQGYPQLQSKFEASLSYMRLSQKIYTLILQMRPDSFIIHKLDILNIKWWEIYKTKI